MAWGKTSSRTRPLPPDWWRRRGHQLKADGYRCTHIRVDTGKRCTEKATDVHHINGPNDDDALTSLCQYHHMQVTGRDAAEAKRKRRPGVAQIKHPGVD